MILESINNLIQESQKYTIVFIKGNTEYAFAKNQLKELEEFYSKVISIIKKYTSNLIVIESNIKSNEIPLADKYIGHSRGCGYEHAIEKSRYFCLDDYEKVPNNWNNGIEKDTPFDKRPKLHSGHMELNFKMKLELIKFLEK